MKDEIINIDVNSTYEAKPTLTIHFPAAENEIFSEEALVGNIFRQVRVNGEVCVITDIKIVENGKAALITIEIPDIKKVIGEVVLEEYDTRGFSIGKDG